MCFLLSLLPISGSEMEGTRLPGSKPFWASFTVMDSRRIFDGAMPARTVRSSIGVGRIVPDIIRMASITESTSLGVSTVCGSRRRPGKGRVFPLSVPNLDGIGQRLNRCSLLFRRYAYFVVKSSCCFQLSHRRISTGR